MASVGGMVKQYQVVVDLDKLRAYKIPLKHVKTAIQRANQETGASVLELAEAEYMVGTSGYISSLDDLENIPLGATSHGTPILLGDVAQLRLGPQMRRGIAELNGEGETVGGIVVMRFGENAQKTIDGVKQKLAELSSSLPEGVEVVTVYDRSGLIGEAVGKPVREVGRGVLGRSGGLCAVLVPPAQFASGYRQLAGGYIGGLYRYVLPGYQRQYHVSGRHSYRHWRYGRRGDSDDRKPAQTHRAHPADG